MQSHVQGLYARRSICGTVRIYMDMISLGLVRSTKEKGEWPTRDSEFRAQ
jgi:hypothetical protein